MLSKAFLLSSRIPKANAVVPMRTLMTCTNHNAFTPSYQRRSPVLYEQKRTFMGPLMRVFTQFFAALGGTSIRAFFQAFQQAAASAEAGENAAPAPQPEFTLRKGISIPESLQILNLKREDVNATTLADQFDKYFAANDPKNGGSFYLQSKVYRAHEALLDEIEKYGYVRDESAKVTPPPAATPKAEEAKPEGEAKKEN